jgi:hypothetical protein
MSRRLGAARKAQQYTAALTLSFIACASIGAGVQTSDKGARIPRWPCRLVVKPTLLGVVEDGWERSPTLRRQCDELAEASTIVVLEWDTTTDSQSRAKTQIDLRDGVVVAMIFIPPVPEAIELVAHELQHVLERVRRVDFEAESKRPGSGVWQAFGGYETKAAIDAGRQVAKELRNDPRVAR